MEKHQKKPFKQILTEALEKTKNVFKRLSKPLKNIGLIVFGFTLATLSPCSRSPTTANAYGTVGDNSLYYHIDLENYIVLATESGGEQIFIKGLWLDLANGRLYFPTDDRAYDSVSFREEGILHKSIAYSTSINTATINTMNVDFEMPLLTEDELAYIRYVAFSGYGTYLRMYLFEVFDAQYDDAIGYIDINFYRNVLYAPVNTINMSGVPYSITYAYGYSNGYQTGYNDGVDVEWGDISPMTAIRNMVDQLLNVHIMGDFTLGHLFLIGIGFLVIGMLLKFSSLGG